LKKDVKSNVAARNERLRARSKLITPIQVNLVLEKALTFSLTFSIFIIAFLEAAYFKVSINYYLIHSCKKVCGPQEGHCEKRCGIQGGSQEMA